MQNTFEKELIAVIKEYKSAVLKAKNNVIGKFSKEKHSELGMRCISVVERASGSKSSYSKRVKESIPLETKIGVVKALLSDIQDGYLKNLEETIHGDLFSDFLEMSTYLVEKKYKDPAAVMAGSTLEVHLRKLCEKHDIKTVNPNSNPKKANTLNANLSSADVYGKLDQKNVTAWLDLRNKAAHGNYDEYNVNQVKNLIDGVRDFIIRHPA